MVGGDGMRDIELEMKLQKSLDNGSNVWVIGDVNWFNHTLRDLISRLPVETRDYSLILNFNQP